MDYGYGWYTQQNAKWQKFNKTENDSAPGRRLAAWRGVAVRHEIFIKYANEGENYFSYIIVIISALTSVHASCSILVFFTDAQSLLYSHPYILYTVTVTVWGKFVSSPTLTVYIHVYVYTAQPICCLCTYIYTPNGLLPSARHICYRQITFFSKSPAYQNNAHSNQHHTHTPCIPTLHIMPYKNRV